MKSIKMIAAEEIAYDQRVLKEAEYLSNAGYDVEILCWDREGRFRDKEIEVIGKFKIKRFFPKAIYGSGLIQIFAFIKFILQCKQYLRNKEYDYLHCQNLDGFVVGYLVDREKQIVFDMREYFAGRESNRIKKFIISNLVDFAIKNSSHTVYVNDTQKTAVKQDMLGKLIFLPNYPDNTLLKFDKKERSDKIRISYIGFIRQYDVYKRLFEAIADMPDVEVSIHGNGTDYNRLKVMEKDHKNIKVTGEYEPKDAGELYINTDITYCVYTNSNENWRTAYPIKLFESILTKTPLIASKGSVAGDFIIEKGIGFVVDEGSVENIRELIMYLRNNRYVLNEKIENLGKIQFEYTWEKVVKNLEMAYSSHFQD